MPDIVAVAADHGGYELKAALLPELKALGFAVLDLGTDSADSVDYPNFANAVAEVMAGGRAQRGMVICGTGIGISIAANRHRHIRCALAHDVTTAQLARQHNDANVLALGARVIGLEVAKACVRTFFTTAFEGGRHARRVVQLS
ncbi:MAG TPA: ribose 5-phosphate isomerase B [Stellaceae bacterium]|jgi:ribose 5-phosphate isomerase B|nr:ribose 5-phosphate isomerase B [Stellaceae bacterium]